MEVMSTKTVCSYAFLFIFLLTKDVSSSELPIWANIREQCPEAKNKTAWMNAASKLDCLHSGESREWKEQQRVYHCLPNSLLNEYVEFCGINAPVEPGYCPVFKYVNTNGRNRGPSYMNCSAFNAGCPQKQYFSREIYNYPECLTINKVQMCYSAEKTCPRVLEVLRENSTISGNVLKNSFPPSTDETVKIIDNEKANTHGYRIIVSLVAMTLFVTSIAALTFILVWVRKKVKVFRDKGMDAVTFLSKRKHDEIQSDDKGRSLLIRERISRVPLKNLLHEISSELEDTDLEKLKFFLEQNDGDDYEDKNNEIHTMDKLELLTYMDSIFHFDLNIYILQGYLENIGGKKLAEKCTKFAQNSNNPMNYYVRKKHLSGFTKIHIKVAKELDDFSREEAQHIVETIQHLLNAKRSDLILSGLSQGCILLHLAVKDTLIPKLRTSNLQGLHKYRVFKISILDECIYFSSDFDLKHRTQSKVHWRPCSWISNSTTKAFSSLSSTANQATDKLSMFRKIRDSQVRLRVDRSSLFANSRTDTLDENMTEKVPSFKKKIVEEILNDTKGFYYIKSDYPSQRRRFLRYIFGLFILWMKRKIYGREKEDTDKIGIVEEFSSDTERVNYQEYNSPKMYFGSAKGRRYIFYITYYSRRFFEIVKTWIKGHVYTMVMEIILDKKRVKHTNKERQRQMYVLWMLTVLTICYISIEAYMCSWASARLK